jgi:hypothetical protein
MCVLVAAPIESMVNARYLRTLPMSELRESVNESWWKSFVEIECLRLGKRSSSHVPPIRTKERCSNEIFSIVGD